jgi:hypothetical protein
LFVNNLTFNQQFIISAATSSNDDLKKQQEELILMKRQIEIEQVQESSSSEIHAQSAVYAVRGRRYSMEDRCVYY